MKMTYRMPEESEEEKKAALIKKMKEEEEKKAAAEGGSKKKKAREQEKPPEEEEKKEEKKPPQPIKVWLYQTSIHDLLISIDKMADYDFVLGDLGLMTSDLTEEKLKVNGKLIEGNDR